MFEPSPALQARIESWSMPVPFAGCWIWLRGCSGDGYGAARADGKSIRAHRLSWIAYRGAIPAGMHVLHQCDIPTCVNPDHLWLGTHAENMADRSRKGHIETRRGKGKPREQLLSLRMPMPKHVRTEPPANGVKATIRHCITFQRNAERAYRFAIDAIYLGRMSSAIRWQAEAAWLSKVARRYLNSLTA